MKVSIIIPVYNEKESLEDLFNKLEEVMGGLGSEYEYIFVDDGSTDGSLGMMRSLHKRSPNVNVISFRRNYGKSAALNVGFKSTRGDVVITIDADLQDDPGEIPKLIKKLDDGYDLVSGWKKHRRDPWTKKVPSKFFNLVTSLISGVHLHDLNCGLKAYRKEVVKSISVYGELHRFIPVLADWAGFSVGEVDVKHSRRRYGKSKYGASRLLNGFFDLITVMFITRRGKNPLHFFGRLAVLLFVIGFVPQVVFFIQYLGGKGLRVRPIMLGGFVLIIVALQIASMGLLAELFSARSAGDLEYATRENLQAKASENPQSEENGRS